MRSSSTPDPSSRESHSTHFFASVRWLVVFLGLFLFGCVDQDGELQSEEETSQSPSETPSHNSTVQDSLDFVELLRFKQESTRSLALRLQLGRSTESSLQEFLLQSKSLPSEQLQQEVQSIVIREFALINPEGALSSTEEFVPQNQNPMVKAVFQVWSISDLNQAIKSASELRGLKRLAAVEGILSSRDDLSETARKDLAKETLGEDYSNFRLDGLFLVDAIEDPEREWEDFIAKYENDLSQLPSLHIVHLGNIASALEKRIGMSVFDRIQKDIPSGQRIGVIMTVLDRLAVEDPSRALNAVLMLKPDGYEHLATRVVSAWGQSDPEAALDALAQVEAPGLRFVLQRATLFAWIDVDPFAVMGSLERVPQNLRAKVSERALIFIAYSSPQEAAKLLDSVEDYWDMQRVGEAIVFNWARTSFVEALNWVRNSPQIPNDSMRHQLLGQALDTLARSDPERALRYALEEEVDAADVGPESSVIVSVAHQNLNKAIELLSQARNARTKEHTVGLMGVDLVSDGESLKAIELQNQLPRDRRSKYVETLTPALLSYDPGVLADNLESLASYDARSRTAGLLLTRYEGKKNALTLDQIAKLKQYRPD